MEKEIVVEFKLHSEYTPTGDQPQAIEALVKDLKEGNQCQGSGLNKIREAYKNAANYQEGMEPAFYSDRVVFMVTLKNLNYKNSVAEAKVEAENYVLNSVEEKIFELLKKDSKITQPEIQKQLNLSRSKVQRTMKKLSENGIIGHVGSRRKGHWKVNI